MKDMKNAVVYCVVLSFCDKFATVTVGDSLKAKVGRFGSAKVLRSDLPKAMSQSVSKGYRFLAHANIENSLVSGRLYDFDITSFAHKVF